MFHFGLPSEPLNFNNCTTKSIKRFEKLLYFESGSDPLPLPIAKNAVYVDQRGLEGSGLDHVQVNCS